MSITGDFTISLWFSPDGDIICDVFALQFGPISTVRLSKHHQVRLPCPCPASSFYECLGATPNVDRCHRVFCFALSQ